eukprot:UN00179
MCAPSIKPATLELGGKSPLIIFEDSNLENAARAALIANFFSQGEICTNGTRIFVQESVYDKFMEILVNKTKKLRIGDPMKADTQIGALIDNQHRESVQEYIKIGKEEGANLVHGGTIPDMPEPFNKGAFLTPAIFGDCQDDMRIAKEEIP